MTQTGNFLCNMVTIVRSLTGVPKNSLCGRDDVLFFTIVMAYLSWSFWVIQRSLIWVCKQLTEGHAPVETSRIIYFRTELTFRQGGTESLQPLWTMAVQPEGQQYLWRILWHGFIKELGFFELLLTWAMKKVLSRSWFVTHHTQCGAQTGACRKPMSI